MSGLDLEGMDEIVEEFLVESAENLDQLDQDLVALESDPASRDLLSSIFRTIHTIKGTSGFLAFAKLEALTHVGENLLSKLRDGVLTVNPTSTDALLTMVDVVRALLSAIEANGTEGDVDISGAVTAVEACLNAGATAAPPAAVPRQTSATDAVDQVRQVAALNNAIADAMPAIAVESTVPGADAATATTGVRDDGRKQLLGELLVAGGQATAEAVARAAQLQVDGDSRRIGEILVASGDVEQRAVEECLESQRKPSLSDSTIRVDVAVLDMLVRQVGELVLTRNQLLRHAVEQNDAELSSMTQRLNLITTELQEGVMRTRMQPVDHVWAKLPRVVRDLAAQCSKKASLVMVGKETELDRSLLEAIKDPLTHIVRNSIDHGIEDPATRVALGKPEAGLLRMAAFHENGRIVIEISDDGAGIDPAKVGAKAVERGMVTQATLAMMSEADILLLIFKPGFSTAAKITNVSGRGVGMDVVRTNVERIGGTVDVSSVLGEGTTFRLTIPLTLAIIQALIIDVRGQRFAVPQVSVLELVSVGTARSTAKIDYLAGAPVYRLRGALLPLVDLASSLRIESDAARPASTIVVVQCDDRRYGLVVDAVLASEEIVVKGLDKRLKSVGAYSGATILGDGHVSLILDVGELAGSVMRAPLGASRGVDTHALGRDRVLVAGIGDDRRVAIPLDDVTRLEEIDTSRIERVGSRDVVHYHGTILPLVRLSTHLRAGQSLRDSGDERLPAVVASRNGRSAALLVERIIDIVEGDSASASASALGAIGLLGSAIVDGQVTELLDVRQAILAADPEFFDTPGGWTDTVQPEQDVQAVGAP